MSVAVLSSPPPPPPHQRPFTVDEYHRLIETGVLKEDDPIELLEGWIVFKMPRNPPHDTTIDTVQEALRQKLQPPAWRVRVQSAITTSDSEPEPDVVVAIGPASRYLQRHPGARDVVLIVEVADASLSHDRDIKARLYARAAIPVYWIVNVQNSTIEVYTKPTGPHHDPSYQPPVLYCSGDTIPLVLPDGATVHIPVHDLFPAANP